MPDILIIDDNEDILTAARLLLKQHGYEVHSESHPEKLPDLLASSHFDVIFLDMNFEQDSTSGQEGMHWLGKICEIDSDAVVVMITAFGDVETAVQTIKAGAFDFILKPWQNEKVLATVSAALQLRESRQQVEQLKTRQRQLIADQDKRYHDMIGVSAGMRQVFRTIDKVAQTDANVLILGENGTGKELVAHALHRQSQRADQVFISVDMGAIPDTLFESEFFGHVKGAFTDAKQEKPGRFEAASGGTLFLDEIANLTFASQGKLLRVLEERQVTRLGSHQSRSVDIRLICATNMNLHDRVADKSFRQDFLYRINTVEIQLPPLRERADDIPLLVDHFLGSYSKKYDKPVDRADDQAMLILQDYAWPGNIRELRHALERAVIMSEGTVLTPESFRFLSAHQPDPSLHEKRLGDLEKTAIENAIRKYQGNMSRVAGELGVTRQAIYRRLQKYGIERS